MNGRLGADFLHPKPTCKNSSTVDYFLSSAYVFSNVIDFKVDEFSPLYSDVHCPVALSLRIGCKVDAQEKIFRETGIAHKLWDPQSNKE